jgi:hypothetical protein
MVFGLEGLCLVIPLEFMIVLHHSIGPVTLISFDNQQINPKK